MTTTEEPIATATTSPGDEGGERAGSIPAGAPDATDATDVSAGTNAAAEAAQAAAAEAGSPVARWLPLVAGLVLALPTLLAYYPPMTDIGLHEGALGLLRHFWDPAYFPPGLYHLNLGQSNQLFYLVGWPLSFVVDTRWACKLVIAASQVLMFTGGARFASYLGRSRWSVLLFAPLALGFTYYWGLVTNLVGFAVFFYALPAIDSFVERPTRRGLGIATGWFVLLFFSHESVLAMAGATLLALTLMRPLSARTTSFRLLPVLFTLAMVAFNHARSEQMVTRGTFISPSRYFSVKSKLLLFSNVLFGSYDTFIRNLLLGVALAFLAVLLYSRRRAREDTVAPLASFGGDRLAWLRAAALRYRFELIGVALGLGYFIVPFNMRGATLLHERFVGPAWGILAVCAAPRGAVIRVGKLLGLVLPVAVLLVSWPQFADASTAGEDLSALLAQIPKGRAVTFCALNIKGVGHRIFSGPSSAARSLAVVGGRAGLSLMPSPIAPVQLRSDLHWTDYELREFIYSSRGFKPAHDFHQFEWVLGESRLPEIRQMMQEAFAPEADLVAARGEWMLFRSKLETVPLDSPDRRAPAEMETTLDRMNYLIAKHRGLPLPSEPPGLMNEGREP